MSPTTMQLWLLWKLHRNRLETAREPTMNGASPAPNSKARAVYTDKRR